MRTLEKIIEYGFYTFIFLLPWQTRWIYRPAQLNQGYWEYGSLSLYATEIILWIVLVCFLIWLIKNNKLKFKPWQEYNKKKLTLLLTTYGLLLISLLTIFWASDLQLAFYGWLRLLEAVSFFVLILNFNFSLIKTSLILVITTALQGVLAIWQFLTQSISSSKWLGVASHFPTDLGVSVIESLSSRWLRAYGSLPHPNILAGLLVIGLILLIGLSFLANERYKRIFVLTCFIIMLPALFFTFSRSAWLALIVSVLLLVFILFFKGDRALSKTLIKIILINLIIFAVLVINFQDLVLTRLLGTQRLEFQSTTQRQIYKEQAKELISQHWLAGVGAGNYTYAVYREIDPTKPAWFYQPVHNIVPLVFTELGIFGFTFFLLLVLLVINYSIRDGLRDNLSIIYFLCFLSLLIISYFDHYLWSLYFGQMLFWLILGLTVKSIKFNPPSPPPADTADEGKC